jgi:ubiquinone/menaquinone biosynthesis C-methylase UbiE
MTKYGYGNFGNLSKHYIKARQNFPQEVIDWLWLLVGNRNIRILDLGCGTGISTRQVAKGGGTVIGCDKDEKMIWEAKKENDGLEYIIAPAEKLPFRNSEFDAITAFSALHWFANERALSEIKRVLKSKGIFYVVNKNDIGNFKRGCKEIIKSVLQQELPEAKKGYKPEELLGDSGFNEIRVKDFATSEYFSLPQAIEYLQSMSIWNLVPSEQKENTLELLKSYCKKIAIEGKIEQKLNIKAVAAQAKSLKSAT